MYVVTGGAGFNGSNIAAALDQQGADIVVSDWMGANDFLEILSDEAEAPV